MAGRLEKKVALITGSTSGCGRACAVRFAAEGARVMVTGRNEEAGEEIVRTIRQAGGEASFFRADISKESEVSDLVRSEEHTSELQSLRRNTYADFCLKK